MVTLKLQGQVYVSNAATAVELANVNSILTNANVKNVSQPIVQHGLTDFGLEEIGTIRTFFIEINVDYIEQIAAALMPIVGKDSLRTSFKYFVSTDSKEVLQEAVNKHSDQRLLYERMANDAANYNEEEEKYCREVAQDSDDKNYFLRSFLEGTNITLVP